MNEILVYYGGTEPVPVGRLWVHPRQQSASFEYDRTWLVDGFALAPDLPLSPGTFHTSRGLFGVFEDACPDRWGRMLLRRMERRRAEEERRPMRSLTEAQILLGVSDSIRQGALRFKRDPNGPFLAHYADGRDVPPLIFLPRLLHASSAVLSETDRMEDLRLLLAPGSSLGGARPKAVVRDRDGTLWIAKFPHREDERDVVLWEAVALQLAENSGIAVPAWRLENVEGKNVLLVQRFDRRKQKRLHFVSAMTLLGARDMEQRSYLEIADALRAYGSRACEDLLQLWRRLLFNVLISNVDDHLRNHGFIHDGTGFRLSPAYDLNPVPQDVHPRVLTTAIFEDGVCRFDAVLEVAEYFDVSPTLAIRVVAEVAGAVSGWRQVAASMGASASEIRRMASAFEHEDLKDALRFARQPRVSGRPETFSPSPSGVRRLP